MTIFDMSLSASCVILVAMVIRELAKHRMPRRVFTLLWGIAVIRLVLPLSIAIPLPKRISLEVTPVLQENIPAAFDGFMGTFETIWLVGMTIALVWLGWNYFRGYRELSAGLPVNNEVVNAWLDSQRHWRKVQIKISDIVSTPLTYGIVKPVIVLPKHTDWGDNQKLISILTHEMAHVRRFDAVKKLILSVVLCMHWFNPLVWAMYLLANRDMELCCDEAVIRVIGTAQKAEYARALIGLSCIKQKRSILSSGFSRYAIEERIVAITKGRRASAACRVMLFAVVLLSCTVFVELYDPVRDVLLPGIDKTDFAYLVEDKGPPYDTINKDVHLVEEVWPVAGSLGSQ